MSTCPASPAPMVVPRFSVAQRITVMVNRYEIRAVNPDGTEGALLALAEQKRMKLKEEVVFFSDESRSRAVFSFKARQRLDVHARHDVLDEHGTPLGSFAKKFGASLLRSTWELSAPGLEAVGRERRPVLAVVRRIWELIPYLGDVWVPFVFHFDFHDTATGAPGAGQRAPQGHPRPLRRHRARPAAGLPRGRGHGGGPGRAAEPLRAGARSRRAAGASRAPSGCLHSPPAGVVAPTAPGRADLCWAGGNDAAAGRPHGTTPDGAGRRRPDPARRVHLLPA
ncbi:hypothetical protein [Blastococcus sp. TF02-09]|uniref:hypothetical protein n=1 Tax=Blastococcus sp. TF02-09 TaxID=2250576 RepID=UPI001F43C5E4|nr:hypothetical protein [Blastococcus sp. TF02-9]